MLRLLLDAHFGSREAEAIHAREPNLDVVSMQQWASGAFLDAGDEIILMEAYRQARTLVTRDLRTITPVLKDWSAESFHHGGVVFVDNHSFPEGNVGVVMHALLALWQQQGSADWTDVVHYLRPSVVRPD